MRPKRLLLLLTVLAGAPVGAHAQEGSVELELPEQYAPLQAWEYVVAPSLLAYAFTARFGFELGEENMTQDILFDEDIQPTLSIEDETYRDIMTPIGDIGFIPMMVYRFVDTWAIAGAVHGRWDIASQMFFIDMEAYGFTAAVIWTMQHVLRKRRPRNQLCRDEPGYRDGECSIYGDDRSFISGHLASAITGASLTCLHHTSMPLYGGGWGDATACGAAIGLAAVTGVARLTTDAHYTTDVLLGGLLGFIGGFVIPKTLHYGWGDADPLLARPEPDEDDEELAGAGWAVAPGIRDQGGTLSVIGRF